MSANTSSIFITGAASGIGRAVALAFAARGWRVGASDVSADGLERLIAEAGQDPGASAGRMTSHLLDVRDRRAWTDALATFCGGSEAPLNVLFNNAGIGVGGPISATDEARLTATVDINFNGVLNGVLAALPHLRAAAAQHERARIINTGSAAGRVALPNMAVYAATKHAVFALTEALNAELAPEGVDVVEINPTFLDTAILDTPVGNTNMTGRDELETLGIKVLPVSLAVDAVWAAATADRPSVHKMVGASAVTADLAQRFAPGLVRRWARKRLT